MSWVAVAKKDFRDAVRSYAMWVLAVVFVVFAAGTAFLYPLLFPQVAGTSTTGFMFFLTGPAGLLIPLTAVVVGYRAIAGERETGSIKLLLGLPHTRFDVLLGKVVGRTGVLVLPVLVGFAVAALVVGSQYASFDLLDYAMFSLVTVLFALTYVCITVGLSAATSTTARAAAAAVGFVLLFGFFWDLVPFLLVYVANGFAVPQGGPTPEWARFVGRLSPGAAYNHAVASVLPGDSSAVGGAALQATGPATGAQPFYLADWFGTVVLFAWLVVLLLVGYVRFRDADL